MKIERGRISKELVAFAYVQEEYKRTGDITAGLMPIFAPIIHEMALFPGEFDQELLHTGQHYNPEMSKVFFDELGQV